MIASLDSGLRLMSLPNQTEINFKLEEKRAWYPAKKPQPRSAGMG